MFDLNYIKWKINKCYIHTCRLTVLLFPKRDEVSYPTFGDRPGILTLSLPAIIVVQLESRPVNFTKGQ